MKTVARLFNSKHYHNPDLGTIKGSFRIKTLLCILWSIMSVTKMTKEDYKSHATKDRYKFPFYR